MKFVESTARAIKVTQVTNWYTKRREGFSVTSVPRHLSKGLLWVSTSKAFMRAEGHSIAIPVVPISKALVNWPNIDLNCMPRERLNFAHSAVTSVMMIGY